MDFFGENYKITKEIKDGLSFRSSLENTMFTDWQTQHKQWQVTPNWLTRLIRFQSRFCKYKQDDSKINREVVEILGENGKERSIFNAGHLMYLTESNGI